MTLLILACLLGQICAVVNPGNNGNSLQETPELGGEVNPIGLYYSVDRNRLT